MGAKFSGEFPDPLNRIEIRTVWRQVIELKVSLMFLAPVTMQGGVVVVFGIVGNDDHASLALAAALVEKTQESPGSRGVKTILLARENKLAVAQTHRAEIAHALARGVMRRHGSLTSGATHIRQRDPCCWKCTSSMAQRSTFSLAARAWSFLCAACFRGSARAITGRGLR